jgi:hypothetical protein
MMERWEQLRQFPFLWPAISAALLATAMRWAMLIVIVAGLVWLVSRLRQRAARGNVEGNLTRG